MKSITELLSTYEAMQLIDEDSRVLTLETKPGVPKSEIQQFEERYGIALPDELAELISYSNGLSLFGVEVLRLQSQIVYLPQKLISFHSWGNGDFDCMLLSNSNAKHRQQSIVFMNHNPDVTVTIADSLCNWISRVVDEIRVRGALFHPIDYRDRDGDGMYRRVLDELRDVPCEINESSSGT